MTFEEFVNRIEESGVRGCLDEWLKLKDYWEELNKEDSLDIEFGYEDECDTLSDLILRYIEEEENDICNFEFGLLKEFENKEVWFDDGLGGFSLLFIHKKWIFILDNEESSAILIYV